MTPLARLTLAAVLVSLPGATIAQERRVPLQSILATPTLTDADRPTAAAADNATFCGNGDILVIYEEDENGNRIEGTEEYGCVYD